MVASSFTRLIFFWLLQMLQKCPVLPNVAHFFPFAVQSWVFGQPGAPHVQICIFCSYHLNFSSSKWVFGLLLLVADLFVDSFCFFSAVTFWFSSLSICRYPIMDRNFEAIISAGINFSNWDFFLISTIRCHTFAACSLNSRFKLMKSALEWCLFCSVVKWNLKREYSIGYVVFTLSLTVFVIFVIADWPSAQLNMYLLLFSDGFGVHTCFPLRISSRWDQSPSSFWHIV